MNDENAETEEGKEGEAGEVRTEATKVTEFWMGENPTPDERAQLIVGRLEQFIREGKADEGGLPFKKWQELAVHEVNNAIRDAEHHWRQDNRFIDRGLLLGAASLITIGVWGTLLAFEMAPDRQIAALILLAAGAVLFGLVSVWGIRRLDKYHQLGRRRDHFRRVFHYDRQLAQLDRDLENRLKELEKSLAEMSKGPLGKL
jgi:hypothetical protein